MNENIRLYHTINRKDWFRKIVLEKNDSSIFRFSKAFALKPLYSKLIGLMSFLSNHCNRYNHEFLNIARTDDGEIFV